MPRYVALLRAINVGGHTVRMADLRAQFEQLGFADVSTYIASGNVRFSSASRAATALERRIAEALEERLGYPVATFVRTPAALAATVANVPFTDLAPSDALQVGFLSRALTATECRQVTTTFAGPDDLFAASGRELYWRRRGRISESAFTLKRFEQALGVAATFRNITTVRALAEGAAQ